MPSAGMSALLHAKAAFERLEAERDQARKQVEELRKDRSWADELTRIVAWESLPHSIRQEIGDRMNGLIAERNRWAKRADQARKQALEELAEEFERRAKTANACADDGLVIVVYEEAAEFCRKLAKGTEESNG